MEYIDRQLQVQVPAQWQQWMPKDGCVNTAVETFCSICFFARVLVSYLTELKSRLTYVFVIKNVTC